jgi:uncharacterized spore protein YtfJ
MLFPNHPAQVTFGELAGTIKDALTAKRVFGDPIERDGIVVIPAAVVFGGGGGGVGNLNGNQQDGGGFGLLTRPVGAFVISNGTARWVPAVDVTALGVIVGIMTWLLTRRREPIR